MALSETGPLGTLTFISVEVVDPDATGREKFIRVRYSLDRTAATEPLVGFYIWHDDEAGSTTPVWVNACDAYLAGGGDGGTPTIYEVLTPVPLATTGDIWWESFEDYALGVAGTMDKGGSIWAGAAVISDAPNPYNIMGETFEDYSDGPAGTLSGGGGFSANAVLTDI